MHCLHNHWFCYEFWEFKYRIKKTQIPKFIKIELKSDSDSDLDLDSEVESKSDAKLMATFEKSGSDSEWKNT